MKRRKFLRDTVLGLCMILLPKVLLPSTGDLEEEVVEIPLKVELVYYTFMSGNWSDTKKVHELNFHVKVKKKHEKAVREMLSKRPEV